MEPRWRVTLFGELGAATEEQVVTRFRTQKTGLLLAYLAYYRQRSRSRAELIELLWPESAPDAGRNSLSTALSWLRGHLEPPGPGTGTTVVSAGRVLGPAHGSRGNSTPAPPRPARCPLRGRTAPTLRADTRLHSRAPAAPPSASAVLVADRVAVRLNPEAVTTDVAEFEAALQAAVQAESPNERAQWLVRAVDRYGGELLAGYYEEWVLQERGWLAERYFQALGQLLKHLEEMGDLTRAIEYAQRGISADPLREEAHAVLMRLYTAAGQPAAALRQYGELERLLKEELGATPAPTTRAMARVIERQFLLQPQSAAARQGVGPSSALLSRGPVLSPAEGENRLVTVLFTEMSRSVGTPRDLHPEDAAALVNRLLSVMVDALLKYEGRVERFLGDGVLAVFGTLQAHEDDAERGIRAALEIRVAARQLGLEVTVGVNTGEVYVGKVGSERHQETTAGTHEVGRGPVVNLAARLQELAQPGEILVGASTAHQSRGAFEFAPRSLAIQGFSQPVRVYAVERAVPRPEKARGLKGLRAELIGREEELAKLEAALAEVLHTSAREAECGAAARGRMVSLIGEAGVGKSRLVAELKAVASRQNRPLLWLEGRCLELGMTAGYSLFVDLLHGYFAWPPDEEEPARVARIVAALRAGVERGHFSAERAEEIGPLLANLLSLRFGNDWDVRLKNAPPEQIKHQTFLAVRDLLVALAQHQPLVLVLEDLHWADTLSLDLISLLMETLTQVPLLLLCVYRPEREHPCWRLGPIAAQKCAGRYTELPLRELSPPQTRRLVESLLTIDALPASVKEWILEKSRGNPFFVEEVVHALIDAGSIYREGEGECAGAPPGRLPVWRAREEIQAVSVPESVQSVILSRVDRLAPEEKQVLQRASVMGRLFPRRLLAAMMQEGGGGPREGAPGGLEPVLWELEERGLIYQERVVPEEEYSFKHVLTQETIYGSLPRRQRAVLHQQAAEAMEALDRGGLGEYTEQLAYHYERSEADEKAVEYLLKAGEKARRAYLNEEAIGYLQRALERLDGSSLGEARKDWRLEGLKGLGLINHAVGKAAEAEEWLRQAIAVGREIELAPRELVRLYFWLGDAMFWQDREEEMRRNAEEGLALLGDDTESVEAALMNTPAGQEYRNALFLERLPYSEELRSSYDSLILDYAGDKNVAEAMKWSQALEQKATQHHDLRALGTGQFYAARAILAPSGDLRGAISRYQRALELLLKIGDAKHTSWCAGWMATAYLALGELQHAAEYAQRGLESARGVGSKRDMVLSYTTLGTIWRCQGAWDRAKEVFQEIAQLMSVLPEQIFRDNGWTGAWTTLSLARGYLTHGEREEGLRQVEATFARARTDTLILASALSALEEACEGPEELCALARRVRAGHPQAGDVPLVQWFLEPTEPLAVAHCQIHDDFAAPLSSRWSWQDPLGDGTLTIANGLEIHAANGRDLWNINLSAPRLLHPTGAGAMGRDEFAIQTICTPASAQRPAIGGILLWKGPENYLRLDRGTRGPYEISFSGCVANRDLVVGRGCLPAERVFLRLERLGSRVNALCSTDGQAWFTVGAMDFPVADPLEVGVHAIGNIDRTIYPGAHPEGTAIRFEAFQVWR